MDELPRRAAMRRGLQILSAITAVPLLASRAQAADQCVEAASQPLRDSLNYKDPSPIAGQACRACGFFTADGKSPCGTCVIMSGPVDAAGHCDSWSTKS
ncbi:MAG TPA: high-potential iron-sulfur protein [Steroidobacteraceae bacterium]